MGTEALWVPAVLAAVGTGVQANEMRRAEKNADETAAQGIRLQAGKQRDADVRVAQEVSSLEGSSPEKSQRAATDAFMQQLQRTRAAAQGGDQMGATSNAFEADSGRATADIDSYGRGRAGVLGRINAPALQRIDENVSRTRAGTDLGLIGRAANADQFLTQLRLQSTQPNQWALAGGQVLTGLGAGMASRGGAGSKPKPYGGTGYGSGPHTTPGFGDGLREAFV